LRGNLDFRPPALSAGASAAEVANGAPAEWSGGKSPVFHGVSGGARG